jgi:hypothetical protein
MGGLETPPFDRGTVALAKAVAASGAISVVGGGDSEKAIKSAGVADKISHISTGGGARRQSSSRGSNCLAWRRLRAVRNKAPFHFVWDGVEARNFLRREGKHAAVRVRLCSISTCRAWAAWRLYPRSSSP